ncbi:MAG: flavin-dependent dehydrogenase, partial [Myxococcota bacterium]
AQQCHDLADEGAARAWVDSQGAPWGDRLCFTGISTGYSILNVRVHAGEVAILTGAHATGPRSGGQLLDDFVAAHPWIGAKRSGSRRAIPIGPPRRPLARGNVAALGDAAGQVFAAHGSGIGQQLVGARILADALAAGEGVLGYMCRWESRFGPQLDASAAFAELSRTLSPDQLARMMHAGLFVPAIVRATLEQHTPAPGPLDLLRLVRGVAREPVLARTLAVGAARVVLGR